MVKTFKADDWNEDIHLINGTKQKGIVILQTEHQTNNPIIQVFEKLGDDQYNLIYDSYRISVISTSTKIILHTTRPFDGKVVIK